ncbi:uncharacterized protein LOC9631004 [Selaginella moellendorffii]|uniref:uncharacterized protein LOC9631004 n=1 Tax=Selaginella moellendorffii TaxID=88036 RepID=UPI000D1CA95E|nr:uncharacterized protein LOC9631004 [Selaginella moellendorffii]|eukprot:XP_024519896.1 uncharacterized protein LOC9631004 [Selaginella moellendorffii]
MSGLMPELVGYILRRLPISSVLASRCVCRAWKAAVDDPSFQSSYTDSARLFPENNYIQDSGGKMMCWEPRSDNAPDWLCAASQDNKHLVLARSTKVRKLYVGNPFFNRWEEVPYLEIWDVSRVFLLVTAGQQFKIVVWFWDGTIHTFSRGQTQWCQHMVAMSPLSPVLIQNKLACIDALYREFVQFDVASNTITIKDLNPFPAEVQSICLASWRGKLYMVWLFAKGPRFNTSMFTIQEVCAESGDPIAVVSTHVVQELHHFTFDGQADNYLNVCGYNKYKVVKLYPFSYDFATDSWADKIYSPPSAPLDVRLCK